MTGIGWPVAKTLAYLICCIFPDTQSNSHYFINRWMIGHDIQPKPILACVPAPCQNPDGWMCVACISTNGKQYVILSCDGANCQDI